MDENLDLTDKKLLFELDMNARATNAELASKLKISKQAVQYRINRLKEKEVLKGFYAVIDISKIGFMYVRFFIKFKDTDAEKEDEIIAYALNNPSSGWVVTIDGNWDFCVALIVKDNIEIKEVMNDFLLKYGKYAREYQISIANYIHHFQNRFLLESKRGEDFRIGGRLEDQKIDQLDRKILLTLCSDARIRLITLASKLGESYKVISYRIRQLEKSGVIKCYRADLDFNKLGYTHYKIFINTKDVTAQSLNKLKEYLKLHPNTIYVTEAIGMADIEFEVVIKDYAQFHAFMQQLRLEFSQIIREYHSIILYKFYQINYLPSLG